MYIADVHIVQFVPWKNTRDFSLTRAILHLFVHEMSAPIHGITNVILYVIMGHSSKDVTMEFIIREVLFIECFFPSNKFCSLTIFIGWVFTQKILQSGEGNSSNRIHGLWLRVQSFIHDHTRHILKSCGIS